MRVLATKLHQPAPRDDLVARLRLQEHLSSAEHGPARLVLLSAPAGYGKTTALTQWLTSGPAGELPPVAWVSLDAGDNDPRRFLTHLVAALKGTNPDVGQEAAAVLEAMREVRVEAVLTSLVNDLDTLAGPTVIALDDFHEITTPALHQALGFLVDHLPQHVRLAVTTREDPPLPLARLRSTGRLVELRAADLRFSPDEVRNLLNDVRGLELATDQVDALGERTEGWAAGLQLAALSLHGHEDVPGFVDAFAGSHRFVLDYLVEEVLERQPEQVRDFLLRTSVLRRMNASLCAALTGRDDAQSVLESLDRANVFVVPLDDHRSLYRYHRLFADALQVRLASSDAARVGELHRAASRWLAEHGALEEALLHASTGGDDERAADLVELTLPVLRRTRHDDTLRAHLARLPDEVMRRRPLLATAAAWSRLAIGDLAGVEAWLDDAERAEAGDICPTLRTWHPLAAAERDQEVRQTPAMVAVYRASVAQARGDVAGTTAYARRALDLTGPADHVTRGAAAAFLGLAAWAAGDLVTAVDTFTQATVALRAGGSRADGLGSSAVLAAMWLGRGVPDAARVLLEQALDSATRDGGLLPTAGDLHVALADVLREQADLAGAVANLDAARALGDAGSLPEHRHRWFTVHAGVLRAEGDLGGALEALDHAQALYQPGFLPDLHPIPSARARVLVAQGRLDEADAWARASGATFQAAPSYLTEHGQLTLARLAVARPSRADELGAVVDLLDRIVGTAEAAGRAGSVVEARMVRALARARGGDAAAARVDIAAALALGVPTGYRRLFLDEGPALVALLEDLVARPVDGESVSHAGQLLAAAEHRRPATRGRGQPPSTESLSERELEVLRLLATDLSGPDMARRLFVSVNTLRTHTKHIFTKLAVTNRRAAVRRAAQLGLLDGPGITT